MAALSSGVSALEGQLSSLAPIGSLPALETLELESLGTVPSLQFLSARAAVQHDPVVDTLGIEETTPTLLVHARPPRQAAMSPIRVCSDCERSEQVRGRRLPARVRCHASESSPARARASASREPRTLQAQSAGANRSRG
jgi:hypothetical protein